MSLSRREFLWSTGAGLGALAWAGSALGGKKPAAAPTPAGHEVIIGAMQIMSVATKKREFALVAIDPAGSKFRVIPLAFHMHGFAAHPSRPHLAALFEKKGPGACLVDLASGQVVQPITTPPERGFYGHGAWSTDGKVVFATETILATQQGAIVVRDGKTFHEIGRFPSHGEEPHDCHLIEQGRVLAITNGGGPATEGADPPSVTWVEVSSGKLLEKLTFPTPRINAGHLALSARGDLAVVSAPRKGLPKADPGGLSLRAKGAAVVTAAEPKDVVARMVGETLSVAIHEPSLTVAATNPDGNLLTFWSLREAKLLKAVTLDHPRGVLVTPDGKHFAVTHGTQPPEMSFISTETLNPGTRAPVKDANMSGSHIYNWKV